MILRFPTNCGDETCPSCVAAGDFLFLAHHAGGYESDDPAVQARAAFESVQRTLVQAGAKLTDMVQITLYLRDLKDFSVVRDVFPAFFPSGEAPARMTATSDFLDARCRVMVDGVAYRKGLSR